MASSSSSMCGPSNPLQSLKNHASFDRSLQQDRFRSHPSAASASQQFRQQSHLNPHLQQHDEFEQFLSASPAAAAVATGPAQALHTRPSLQNFSIAPPSPALHQAGWAADFQRLQLSTPPPPQSLHTIQKPVATGWGAEFLSQLNVSPAQQQQQQNTLMGGSLMGINTGYMPMTSSYEPLQSNHVDTKASYTDAEFDQMFEEAAILQSDILDFPQREVPNPLLQNTNASTILQSEDVKEDVKEEQDKSRDDADELARTAGQLVDTLSQDTSRKFQESQFVALMRKLRDKSVKVEDGKMVEV
ncbi:hypothetical protein TWF718_010720 [Orbilia javanica]|uniref:Peroxin 20 n=1 Tax=Orbilia javanica TaxID=47235 RepID=A0AAN8MMF0_9PEZI